MINSPHLRPVNSKSLSNRRGEEGYLLLGVVVLVALVLVALAVAAPMVAKDLRREKEVESEHRAQQYVRAIRLFYRKNNTYPPSIDALKQTSNIRFLRQEYADPLTGKSDWRILHLGEQKTTVKVFFGKDLGAMGASGGMGTGLGSATGLSSGIGGSSGTTGTTIGATSALASGFSGASIGGSSGSTGATGSGFGSSGSTGGVGSIIGVGSAKTGPSILTPNKQTTYETWEFWYDPRIELLYKKGQMNAGMSTGSLGSQSAASMGASGATGSSSTFGSSTFGSSPASGTSAPTTPSTPGQSSTAPQ